MKHCNGCSQDLPIEAFGLRKKGDPSERQSRCIECLLAHSRAHYAANRAAYIGRANQRRLNLREELRQLKTAPCMDCGVTYPWYVMDFDHRDGESKTDIVSRIANVGAAKRLREEIAKCDLVCANCHRVRTFTRIAGLREPAIDTPAGSPS